MTITEAKAKLIAWCNAQVGYTEGANNYNKYAPKWAQAGGWNAQNQPWCDIFVDCGFIECFGIDLASRLTYQPKGGFSALCSASADFYRRNGAYYSSPEVGDQIFFNVSGGINHTGIVVKVTNATVEAVEGNSSDAVRKNVYALGSAYINGYGRPNWGVFVGGDPQENEPPEEDEDQQTEPEPKPAKPTVDLPTVKQGDTGELVRAAQFLLNGRKCSVGIWGADGDFGPATLAAVKAFQRRNDLEVDGIIGPETWAALLGV